MSAYAPVDRLDDIVFAIPKRKSEMAAPSSRPSKDSKNAASNKKHQRSRLGCYTCRLRRKKCDEGTPCCKACKHLGLRCDYKRPNWWTSSEQRRDQKDFIKEVIKRGQIGKKKPKHARRPLPPIGSVTPPGLCHSATTPETQSDSMLSKYSHSRSVSVDQSPLNSLSGSSIATCSPETYFSGTPYHHFHAPQPYGLFAPCDIDIKTEHKYFVNDVETRRDSTISSFSTFQPVTSSCTDDSPALSDTWVHQETYETQREDFPVEDEAVPFDFFDLAPQEVTPVDPMLEELDERDQPLLDHFCNEVAPLLFPILDATSSNSAQRDIIFPALQTNKCYRHCCLSVAGMHLKALGLAETEVVDEQIMRHRYATIAELCASLDRDEDHEQILEATLAMIFHPSAIARPDDPLPDVPWHQHLSAAKSLAERLGLPERLLDPAQDSAGPASFNMTLTAWIDILGATMQGKSPVFSHIYHGLIISSRSAGLVDLMGCDDNLMFLISEIACLEERKNEGLDEVMLCRFIEHLGTQISLNEARAAASSAASTPTMSPGAFTARDLTSQVTAAFRFAARIYLCSLVPGFDIQAPSMRTLVDSFVEILDQLPMGDKGFDRSLAWPLLIAGASSLPDSPFRTSFEQRCEMLGSLADIGSLGRVREILKGLWIVNDDSMTTGLPRMHWRVVMQQKGQQNGWDCLLI